MLENILTREIIPSNDEQCRYINKLLKHRPRVIPIEFILNNILTHYFVGFLLIDTLCKINIEKNSKSYALLLIGVIIGGFTTDTISYFVHMFIDSKLWRTINKVEKVGRTIVNMHHEHTMIYSYLDSTELVCTTYPILIPIMLFFSILNFNDSTLLANPLYVGSITSTYLFGLLTAHSHKWAHERTHGININIIIKKLQDYKILLDPVKHRNHHEADDNNRFNFSLTNGLAEPYLDKMLFYFRKHTPN